MTVRPFTTSASSRVDLLMQMTRPVLQTEGRADASVGMAMIDAPIRALVAAPTAAARNRFVAIADSLNDPKLERCSGLRNSTLCRMCVFHQMWGFVRIWKDVL